MPLLLCSVPVASGAPLGSKKRMLEPARLSYVSPAVRTQTRRKEWLEALPDQAVENNTRIATSKVGGAEVTVGSEVQILIEPETSLLVKKLPRGGRGAGELQLLSGAILVRVGDGQGTGPLLLRTEAGELRLQAATVRLSSDAGRVRVAVLDGQTAFRLRKVETPLRTGQGALIAREDRTVVPRELPTAPRFPDEGPDKTGRRALLALVPHELAAAPQTVELRLDFAPARGALRYQFELARDARFREHATVTELDAPSFQAQLVPGLYYVRVTALDGDGLRGPTTPARAVYLLPFFTNATRKSAQAAAGDPFSGYSLQRQRGVTVRATGSGLPLTAGLGERARQDCQGECLFQLSPGEHRLHLAVGEAESEVVVTVTLPPTPPPPPPPPRVEERVEPIELAAPLFAAGYPGRALDPRTRLYALFGIGATSASTALNVGRLDVGGEVMLMRRRLSLDLNLPLIYYAGFAAAAGDLHSGLALGDISVGGRFVAVEALRGQLRFGPLLRLQAPTGTYERGANPMRPVVIDAGLGLAANLGRVGLLTTQALPVSIQANGQPTELRWAMSYLLQVRVWRLALVGELDAAVGLVGPGDGAAAGGGVRLGLGSRGQWRILAGARGGLGSSGAAIFGRYTAQAGLEWLYQ